MTAPDINRGTSNVVLAQEVSSEIWAATLEESAIMSLARRIQIPGTGLTIQTITGEPVADRVDETAAKPIGTHTFGQKAITPYKLAVIEPFSMEFRRDKAALYEECVRRAPYALAKKFDETVLGMPKLYPVGAHCAAHHAAGDCVMPRDACSAVLSKVNMLN